MAEVVIHVMKKGPQFKEGKLMVNYKCFNYVPSEYPATRNVINNVMAFVPGERQVFKIGDTPRILRPEQKCVSFLKKLISRFSQAGDIVVNPFTGTYQRLSRVSHWTRILEQEDLLVAKKTLCASSTPRRMSLGATRGHFEQAGGRRSSHDGRPNTWSSSVCAQQEWK